MIPMSAYAYLKAIQHNSQLLNEKSSELLVNKEILAKIKTKELIWGRESSNEI